MSTKPTVRELVMPHVRPYLEERADPAEAAALLHTIEGAAQQCVPIGPIVYRLPGGQIGFDDGWPIEPWPEPGPWMTAPRSTATSGSRLAGHRSVH